MRSRETWWSRLASAVPGGRSAQSSSISRSRETTSFACRRRIARRARCFAPPTGTQAAVLPDLERPEKPELHLPPPSERTLAPSRELPGSGSGVAWEVAAATSAAVRLETRRLERNRKESHDAQPHSKRRILIAALAGAALAALGAHGRSSHASPRDTRELLKSHTTVAPLAAGTTYRASLISPTPSLTPSGPGWGGAQFVSHQKGKVRYETAALFWKDSSGHELDIVSGPAMTLSPASALGWARGRTAHWDFSPYPRPAPVKRWAVAGRQALYFDATVPQPPGGTNGVWTLIGSNPPELQVDGDQSFRMTALSVRGKTVVIVIRAPHADFAPFLPTAKRLVASLQFPPS